MLAEGSLESAYEILATIGQGGFGVVYKARQRATGQLVAIKTVLPRSAPDRSEKVIARFLRETQLCAQLYHPNIVQLIDAGTTKGGDLYTVFAFAPGKSLNRIIADEGALDPEETRFLMLQVLDALTCAHDHGIVHRDIKPANIMIIPTSARRNAVVLDFGISTVIKTMESDDFTSLTGTEEMIGTPGYAAPEQIAGRDTSPATDIFSWGLVFLECLTGKRVFSGASLHEMLFKQLGPEPVPIPQSLLHHPLGKLLREITAKDPSTRSQNAAQVLKKLEACSLRGITRGTIAGETPIMVVQHFNTTITQAYQTHSDAPSTIITAERRQVTALCCNLSLFPIQSTPSEPPSQRQAPADVDIEEQNKALVGLFERCARIAQEHHGFLGAVLGEQALFFFGYPHADEQEAKRAARAALAMRAAMREERAKLASRNLDLCARFGMHSGLVVTPSMADITDSTNLTLGITPSITARITELCPPETILVSAAAQRILRSSFNFDAGGLLQDTSRPISLFQLLEEVRSHIDGMRTTMEASVSFVGREPELKLLMQKWSQAQQGTGQCSLISGEPGIGKSRLSQELLEHAAQNPHMFLMMRCSQDAQNSPLFPVIDMLDRFLEREGGGARTTKFSKLEALLSRHALDLNSNMPLFAGLLGIPLDDKYTPPDISPDLKKQKTFAAVRSLLFAMAEVRPLLWLVEDLHWVDPTTLEFLAQCINEVASAPVCMVLTARPEFSQTALPSTGVLQISLSRLGMDEVEALVAELFEGRDVPEEVLKQIVKRSEGVPLFVEEFTQMLLESGVLVAEDDHYALARPLRDADVPSSLRDLLASRLDRVGQAKETAQLAATIGREFGLALLVAAGTRSAEQVEPDLEKLQTAGLIQSKRKRDDRGYVFKHALIRDAAYESMPLATRRYIHARLAKTLEEQFPQIVAGRPDLLAQHHAAAEQRHQAIDYAQKAAKQSLQRSAYAEAVRQMEQALPWAAAIPNEAERVRAELEVNSLMMPALMASVGYGHPQLETLTARILTLSDAVGKTPHTFPTLYALATYHHLQSHRRASLEVSERLVALAKESGDSAQDLAAHAILAQCYIMAGRLEEGRAAAERSVSLHDPIHHRQMALTYGVDLKTFGHLMLGQSLCHLGYLDRAVVESNNAIAWAREQKLPDMLSLSLFIATYVHRLRREPERIIELTDEAIAITDRYGLPFAKSYALLMRGWATHNIPELSAILEAHKAVGQGAGTPFMISILAEAEAAHGQLTEAIGHLDEALQFSEKHEDYWYLAGVLTLKGRFLRMRDSKALDAAEACVHRALEVAQKQGAKTEELDATMEWARILNERGKKTQAHEMLQKIYSWFTEGLDTKLLQEARRLLEELESH